MHEGVDINIVITKKCIYILKMLGIKTKIHFLVELQKAATVYFFFKDIRSLKIISNFNGSRNLYETFFKTRYFKVPLKLKN